MNLIPHFHKAAEKAEPQEKIRTFAQYLESFFDAETARSVLETFQKLGLPAPVATREFEKGTEGVLVLVNRYGLVIRIETKDVQNNPHFKPTDRINDSPWIVQPIGTIDAGKAVIEICPGLHHIRDETRTELEAARDIRDRLMEQLAMQNIVMWDDAGSVARNIALLPVTTREFPEGIPVVVDRTAVRHLPPKKDHSLGHLFNRGKDEPGTEAALEEAVAAVNGYYAPFRQSFDAAWASGNMQGFWDVCKQGVKEKRLVAGWAEKHNNGLNDSAVRNVGDHLLATKSFIAAAASRNYEARLRAILDRQPDAATAVLS